jgi:hypothetical protein
LLSLNSLPLFSEAPKKLVDFYRQVLVREPKWIEGEYGGFEVGACLLVIGPHGKVQGQSRNPERMIMNFETGKVKGEFERMKGMGAKVITEPYSLGAEPHAFCLGEEWVS